MYKWLPSCIIDGYGVVHYNDFLVCYGGVSSTCFRCLHGTRLDSVFPFLLSFLNDHICTLVCKAG
jgi:hypothetical protein